MTTTILREGAQAPDITLNDDQGNSVSLRDLKGQSVILYFYPKDDTPGCTTQACDLRDNWGLFNGHDIVLYGVSADDAGSHVKFRAKHDLPFGLLVDDQHELSEAFGLWVEKSMYGKTYMGIERSTVVIDEDGVVKAVLHKVKPTEHVGQLRKLLGL